MMIKNQWQSIAIDYLDKFYLWLLSGHWLANTNLLISINLLLSVDIGWSVDFWLSIFMDWSNRIKKWTPTSFPPTLPIQCISAHMLSSNIYPGKNRINATRPASSWGWLLGSPETGVRNFYILPQGHMGCGILQKKDPLVWYFLQRYM